MLLPLPAGLRTSGVARLMCLHAWTLAIQLLCLVDVNYGLVCWHCIAENCHGHPEDNSRAEQKTCLEGQTCQKVVFEMQSDIDETKYKSTVRSCADECIPRNDFDNCTDELYTMRGCVKRVCCSDDDLCNTAYTPVCQVFGWYGLLLLLTSFLSWRRFYFGLFS